MKKLSILLFLLLLFVGARANDGVFFASGNQLIPITETDISVKKEVLTINRVGDHLEVTVYYEFYNPSSPKDLLVGFEADPSYPFDSGVMEAFPEQPYMRNFTVTLNGDRLNYEVANVMYGDNYKIEKSDYYKNGRFNTATRKQCENSIEGYDELTCPFYYVYHFNAHFRKGLNIVQHTYEYDLSMSVGTEFEFPYVLTAANRWANHQIDDFTLNINMGDCESFIISPTFFKSLDEWKINGVGRKCYYSIYDSEHPMFHLREGGVTFHKDNFHPEDELYINKPNIAMNLLYGSVQVDQAMDVVKTLYNHWDLSKIDVDRNDFNADQRRIMKNVPFAMRGYVFKTKSLQDFFESTDWYVADPDYKADMTQMTPAENRWIQYWSE